MDRRESAATSRMRRGNNGPQRIGPLQFPWSRADELRAPMLAMGSSRGGTVLKKAAL